jgi:hypothetical protein
MESRENKDESTTNNTNVPEEQALMSGGLKELLGRITTWNRSGESISSMLPEQQHASTVSVKDETRTSRRHSTRLHNREVSSASQVSQQIRATSLQEVSENGAAVASPKGTVASSKKKRFRLSALIPFLLSAAAFGFSLVLVLAGSRAGYMTDLNIISVSQTVLRSVIGCLTIVFLIQADFSVDSLTLQT